MSSDTDDTVPEFADRTTSARRVVDWIIAVLLVFIGLAVSGVGGILLGIADRDWFLEIVEDEAVESDVFTTAELADLLFAGTWWGGLGVLATGIAMLLTGVLFGIGRHRIDRLEEGTPTATFVANALLGGVITSFTSFIPFSGLLGGGVAGYLESDDIGAGTLVGGASGLVIGAPLAIIALFISIGFAAEGFAVLSLLVLIGILVTLTFIIGIGAVGGAVGSYLRAD